MFKMISTIILLSIMMVFAADTTALNLEGLSDNGVLGNLFVSWFGSLPVVGAFALTVWGVVQWGVQWAGRKWLAKIPTVWGIGGPSFWWKLLGFIFGKIVYLKNATVDPMVPSYLYKAAQEKLDAAQKKYLGTAGKDDGPTDSKLNESNANEQDLRSE